jgi:hypothetical protein
MTLKRWYYGGTDLAFGLFLYVNSAGIPGGYADMVALFIIIRGLMTLSRSFVL